MQLPSRRWECEKNASWAPFSLFAAGGLIVVLHCDQLVDFCDALPLMICFGWTLMVFGFIASAFGSRSLSTPLSKSAAAVSDSTSVGRLIWRMNEPWRRSWR